MPKEEFKTIEAYPNYEASAMGRIRRKSTGKILSAVDNGKGYKVVKLYNSQRPQGRLCLIHRLVLSTFHRIDADMDVNHKDGNKGNNSLVNLEWVTKSENTRHAHLTGLFKGRDKLSAEAVREIKRRVSEAQRESYARIAEDYAVRPSIISKIANGTLYDYV